MATPFEDFTRATENQGQCAASPFDDTLKQTYTRAALTQNDKQSQPFKTETGQLAASDKAAGQAYDLMGNRIHHTPAPSESQLRDRAVRSMFNGQILEYQNQNPTRLTDAALGTFADYFRAPVNYLISNPFRSDFRPTHGELVTKAEELLARYHRATSPSVPFRIVQRDGVIMLQHQGLGPGRWVTEDIGFRISGTTVQIVNANNPRQVWGTIQAR